MMGWMVDYIEVGKLEVGSPNLIRAAAADVMRCVVHHRQVSGSLLRLRCRVQAPPAAPVRRQPDCHPHAAATGSLACAVADLLACLCHPCSALLVAAGDRPLRRITHCLSGW
jgi:hypothetical protein